jgi:hypothetical protein
MVEGMDPDIGALAECSSDEAGRIANQAANSPISNIQMALPQRDHNRNSW